MMDPLNQLPTDPEWIKKVEEVAAEAAKGLGCMVMMVAIQEGGKLAVEIAGVPKSGELYEAAQNPPRMLATLAQVCAMQDAQAAKGKKH